MKELFIYRGLPGSGKTTRAKEFQKNIGARLVGRDHIRDLLFGLDTYVPTGRKENMVTALQEKMIREGLRDEQPVIVDDMNLRAKYVRRFMEIARDEGAEFSIIDLTNMVLEECILRDAFRTRTVGEDVLRDLHKRFIQGQPYPLPLPTVAEKPSQGALYMPPKDKPKAVIVDIDGTVAFMGDRSPFDETRVHEDAPNEPVIDVVWSLYSQGYKILFTSARTAGCYAETRQWLEDNTQLGNFELFMRNEGDYRKDSIVKTEIFDQKIRHNYNVVVVLDDRDQVVKNWRDMGLTCLQVAEGNF